jgi:hypothetical protein
MCSMSRSIQNIFKQIQLYIIFQGNHYPLSCQTIYEWYFSPNVIAVTGYIPGFLMGSELLIFLVFCVVLCLDCFRSGFWAQMLPTYLNCLFSFWVLGPNAAYVSGLFVFVLGPVPKCCLRIWIVCFRSGSWAQMLPTYLECLFSFWVLCPNAAYVSELFVFVLGPVPKCCLRIWIVCFCSGSWAQMLPTYLDCLFSFWVLGPNAAYVFGLLVFVLGPGPKCCLCIWIVFSNI